MRFVFKNRYRAKRRRNSLQIIDYLWVWSLHKCIHEVESKSKAVTTILTFISKEALVIPDTPYDTGCIKFVRTYLTPRRTWDSLIIYYTNRFSITF